MKLFIYERRETYVIAAEDHSKAFEICSDLESDSYISESTRLSDATVLNVSNQWANLEPSNLFDGQKTLKDIAPDLF
jgi:hypothetical protein